jgi:hypothetical protein
MNDKINLYKEFKNFYFKEDRKIKGRNRLKSLQESDLYRELCWDLLTRNDEVFFNRQIEFQSIIEVVKKTRLDFNYQSFFQYACFHSKKYSHNYIKSLQYCLDNGAVVSTKNIYALITYEDGYKAPALEFLLQNLSIIREEDILKILGLYSSYTSGNRSIFIPDQMEELMITLVNKSEAQTELVFNHILTHFTNASTKQSLLSILKDKGFMVPTFSPNDLTDLTRLGFKPHLYSNEPNTVCKKMRDNLLILVPQKDHWEVRHKLCDDDCFYDPQIPVKDKIQGILELLPFMKSILNEDVPADKIEVILKMRSHFPD